jgi:hypothetical protein
VEIGKALIRLGFLSHGRKPKRPGHGAFHFATLGWLPDLGDGMAEDAGGGDVDFAVPDDGRSVFVGAAE